MSEPFLGEIKMFSFGWAPEGWALCDGAILPILQNQALYSLLGAQYGQPSTQTFTLPDLRGRVPVSLGNGLNPGMMAGVETVTLTPDTSAYHTHEFVVTENEGTSFPNLGGFLLAQASPFPGNPGQQAYSKAPANTTLSQVTSSYYGGDESHNNVQPTIVTNYCISLEGTYPQRG